MTEPEGGKLSKEEVDALLKATRQEERVAEKPEPVRRVHGYDFQQPSRFNKSEMEGLRSLNEKLSLAAATTASRLLRTSVKVQLVSMEHVKWENLLDEVPESTMAFVVLMNPLTCRGLISVEGQFAQACLERMIGGAVDPKAPVSFTDMDVRIFGTFVRAFLAPLPELWSAIGLFQVELGQFTEDLASLDLFGAQEDFFQLSFLVQSTAGSGQVVLSVPFEAVRSLPPEGPGPSRPLTVSDEATGAAMAENLKRAAVELSVVLGSADIRVAKLVSIEPGDVIMLGRRLDEPLDVMVNDKVKFRGHPGVSRGKLAVKLIVEE